MTRGLNKPMPQADSQLVVAPKITFSRSGCPKTALTNISKILREGLSLWTMNKEKEKIKKIYLCNYFNQKNQ